MTKLHIVYGLLCTFSLACSAAAKGPSFGLQYQYKTTNGVGGISGSGCMLPGGSGGTTIYRLSSPDATPNQPALWMSEQSGEGDAAYNIEIYSTKVPANPTDKPVKDGVLKQVSYDKTFGEQAKQDSFAVPFQGVDYRFQFAGVPGNAGQCAKLEKLP